MRLRLSLAVVGTLIGGLSPAFAQSSTVSAEDQQLVAALRKSWETAYNKKDVAGVVALYAEDGMVVAPAGIFQGRAALQKCVEADLQAGGHDMSLSVTGVHALGNALWSFRDWNAHYGPGAAVPRQPAPTSQKPGTSPATTVGMDAGRHALLVACISEYDPTRRQASEHSSLLTPALCHDVLPIFVPQPSRPSGPPGAERRAVAR